MQHSKPHTEPTLLSSPQRCTQLSRREGMHRAVHPGNYLPRHHRRHVRQAGVLHGCGGGGPIGSSDGVLLRR